MKGDWERCLEIRLAEIPVHDVKWTLLMAEMKVELTGLKAAAWKYWASLRLVVSWRRILLAWFGWESFGDCWAGELGSSGMFHRPLVWSHKPGIITWLCFKIFTSNLVKMAMQSSYQSCPMEMREPVVMSLKTWANCTLKEGLFDSFKVARRSGLMVFLLAT